MGRGKDWDRVGEVVSKIKELGLTYKEGAEEFGLKEWELYAYKRREKKRGNEGAACVVEGEGGSEEEHPDTPEVPGTPGGGGAVGGEAKDEHDGLLGLPSDVKDLICSYRRAHPQEGFRRIKQELRRRYQVLVTRKRIRSVLKDAGLLESCDSSFDKEERKEKGTRRFEASHPGELYQMDVSYVYLEKQPTLYLVVVMDDHSRFCVAADLCGDQKGDTLIGVLHNACVAHGYPQKLLTDQGSGFYTWSFTQTRFQHYVEAHHIEHIVAEPHSPQTQGKVERLIQTVQKELLHRVRFSGYAEAREAITRYVASYNYDRSHQSLGGQCPADRFYGVSGEVSRVEGELVSSRIDVRKGFLVFRIHGRTLSAVCCSDGLQVYLDGVLLKEDRGRERN